MTGRGPCSRGGCQVGSLRVCRVWSDEDGERDSETGFVYCEDDLLGERLEEPLSMKQWSVGVL